MRLARNHKTTQRRKPRIVIDVRLTEHESPRATSLPWSWGSFARAWKHAWSTPERPEADSLDLLQAVYRNPDQPLHTRIRCGAMALPFERPKLAVTATINGGDFAERLDKAIERSRNSRNGVVIEHQPAIEHPASGLGLTLRRRD